VPGDPRAVAPGRNGRLRNDGLDWQRDFPMREEVEDYAGRQRVFVITCHEGGLGFTVRATEEGREGTGYEFAAYSETSPYSALGRVRADSTPARARSGR